MTRPAALHVEVAPFVQNIRVLRLPQARQYHADIDELSRWAWQNTHMTRHIPDANRTKPTLHKWKSSKSNNNSKKQKTGRRLRPPTSMSDKLHNLNLLLNSTSLKRWPLGIRFFREDVFKIWEKLHTSIIRAGITKKWRPPLERIRPGMNIMTDFENKSKRPNPARSRKEILAIYSDKLDSAAPVLTDEFPAIERGLSAVTVDYSTVKPHLQKSLNLMACGMHLECTICNASLSPQSDLVVFCPTLNCNMNAHLDCLADTLLRAEGIQDTLLPHKGQCPQCHVTLEWASLMQELTLRTRDQAVVDNLFKIPAKRKAKTSAPPDNTKADEDPSVLKAGAIISEALKDIEDDRDWMHIDNEMIISTRQDTDVDSSSDDDDGDKENRLPHLPSRDADACISTPAADRIVLNSDWDDIDQVLD